MIESLLKSVFKKVNRQKVKWTVHSPNRQKFEETAGDARFKFSVCVFFLACMNSYSYCLYTWIHYTGDKMYCSWPVHESHNIIHIFKNY